MNTLEQDLKQSWMDPTLVIRVAQQIKTDRNIKESKIDQLFPSFDNEQVLMLIDKGNQTIN